MKYTTPTLVAYKRFLACIFSLLLLVQFSFAQQAKHRIAVFAPVYIDSAFDGKTYKLWGNYLPKNMLPGLEFYNGMMMALDSLKSEGIGNLIIDFYDYRSKGHSLNRIIEDSINKLEESKVIIASFNSRSDIKPLADYAKDNHIPLISATYPNDGGISNNSYFFLLNPTLRNHCKAIYQHLQRLADSSNIVFVSRKGSFEKMIETMMDNEDSLASKRALNLKPVFLTDSFSTRQITAQLDSTKANIILCGTANEYFATRLFETVAPLTKYKTTIIGMPTWDGLKGLNKSSYKGLEIMYTSAYNYSNTNKLVARLTDKYQKRYNAKPSDLVFKGYETTLRFGRLISTYGANATQLFSDDIFKVLNCLDIQPTYNSAIPSQIDYYENARIYFIKKVEGSVKSVE